MKPHKMKKFKQRVQFRKEHCGLDLLQIRILAQGLAQQIARDPAKLEAFVAAVSDALTLPEVIG